MDQEFNDQLPVELLLQLVRALPRYRRGQHPRKPEFFFFRFSLCNDLPFVFQQFKCMILWFSLGIVLLSNKLLVYRKSY